MRSLRNAAAAIALAGLAVNLGIMKWLAPHGHDMNARAAALHVLGDILGSVGALVSVPAAREEMAATGRPDPGSVVIDEIAGMLLAATGIPWGVRPVLLLFLLFRVFDVFKFGPAAWLDARRGPVYVVADDLAAGVCAGLAYRGITWLTG